MFLNIITPVTRCQNLNIIRQSINIPRSNFRWICVFDAETISCDVPEDCEAYAHVDTKSGMGNAQRNLAIELVKEGHIYFNDDDTTIHPLLWENINDKDEYDLIHFSQSYKNDSLRLQGDRVANNYIDSHNFVVRRDCVGDVRWVLNRYDADGIFAETCQKRSKNSIFIPKILSVYNSLR